MAAIAHQAKQWSSTYSSFLKTWSKDFKHVSVSMSHPFYKCKVCKSIDKQIMESRTKNELKRFREARADHIRDVRAERAVYHALRNKVSTDPDQICMIIDGMDQRKTDIPGANGKRDRETSTIPTRIIGVKVHSHGHFFFIAPPDVPHDSSVTWSCLLATLQILRSRFGRRRFPTKLWIQMDNTSKDNKTKLALLVSGLLVYLQQFASVCLGFLPVGHTHEDIDALFSVIAKSLRRCPAFTFQQLVSTCKDAFTDLPVHAQVLTKFDLLDFSSLVNTTVSGSTLDGMSSCHNFRWHE